jgi:hypothetical protein
MILVQKLAKNLYERRLNRVNGPYISYKSQIRLGIIFPSYHSNCNLNVVTIVIFTRLYIKKGGLMVGDKRLELLYVSKVTLHTITTNY